MNGDGTVKLCDFGIIGQLKVMNKGIHFIQIKVLGT